MSTSTAAILDDLAARGLLQDSTDPDGLRKRLTEGPICVYAGFDPSADSLHVGNLVPLMVLKRFQEFGHKPIVLAGGATGMIGDPGGRSTERSLLDAATLSANLQAITPQLEMLLDFSSGPTQAVLVDNREWTEKLSALEFLRDIGKYVTVNTMLAKESIRSRVESESGISYTEFSYMLLQANDYRHLHQTLQCELQVGGSDQWGNITAGIDLIRRTSGAHVHGLTVPLITRADGQKFGKSVDGAVWLSPEKTTPYAFYQYFVNADDRDVHRFLLQLTMVSVSDIATIMAKHEKDPGQRQAQKVLAYEVTALIHGVAEAEKASEASRGFTQAAAELTVEQWHELEQSLPTISVTTLPCDLVDLLADNKALSSKSEGRRLVAQGGLKLNDDTVVEGQELTANDFTESGFALVRRGKKQRFVLKRG